jgi:RNA-directed DNA polymerase
VNTRAQLRSLAVAIDVSPEHLADVAASVPAHYRVQPLPEESKVRQLLVPSPELKSLQRRILRCVLRRCKIHPASHCRPGYSILTNARLHVGNSYVSTMDLRDAFPSIRPHAVRASVRRALWAAGLAEGLAEPIAQLCTYRRQLPQGAPTSTTLLDLALYSLDAVLLKAAQDHGLTYSRYVDDLTVSGGRPHAFFRRIVATVVGRFGLHLNDKKTKTWGPGRRATVTGLILDRRPILRADYVTQVRSIIEKHVGGLELLTPKDLAVLRGRISWIRQVHPRTGARLQRLVGM